MTTNRQTAAQPPAPRAPRLFVNTDGRGTRFYYYDSDVTIRYFDPATRLYGNYMPPVGHDKQTFMCTDGTSFTFCPDGSGSYTSYSGTIPISPGRYPWMPPAAVLISIPVVQTPPPRPMQQAVPQERQEEEEEDDESSDDEDNTHRRWKHGLA